MSLLRGLVSYVKALARELSDESAYERHLQRNGHSHSPEEWRRFIDRRLRRKYENAKCC